MRGFSKVILAGNVTRDPELRSTPSGAQVCGFSIAVNRTWRDQSGNQQESVSFFDCSAWGKTGETLAQYAKKGTGLLVSGRLDQRSWDDKTSGQKRSRVEIVVEDFVFTGSRGDGDGAGAAGASRSNYSGNTASAASAAPVQEVVPEDIPENIDLEEVPF